jgi:hypothetical protein
MITDGGLGRFNDESFSRRNSSDNGNDSMEVRNTIERKIGIKRRRKAIFLANSNLVLTDY